MKPVAPSVEFALRTAKGERRRIRSFLKEIESLGVEVEDLPPKSVRALGEADKFLARYQAALSNEVPSPEQLDGVIEGLGGIDRVVRHAMADILRSLGWKPEPGDSSATRERGPGKPRAGVPRKLASAGLGKVIQFPGPRVRLTDAKDEPSEAGEEAPGGGAGLTAGDGDPGAGSKVGGSIARILDRSDATPVDSSPPPEETGGDPKPRGPERGPKPKGRKRP